MLSEVVEYLGSLPLRAKLSVRSLLVLDSFQKSCRRRYRAAVDSPSPRKWTGE